MLSKAAVVCALLALFSAGSQGNKEANVDNHHRAAQKERFLPFVSQPTAFRRGSRSEICLPYSDEYRRRLDLLLCDKKYIRAVFNEIETSNCTNEYYNDTALFNGCGTNDNGDVCAGIDDYIYYDVFNRCYRSFYTSKCSSECQTTLRLLSDSVGCCIHDDVDYDLGMPSVWMNCDIEQPEVCTDTPNTADVLAKNRIISPCTNKCSLRQLLYVFCKNLGEKQEKIKRECGMENTLSHCGFHNGEFCVTMDFPDSYFDTLYKECSNVKDGMCSTYCRSTLGIFIDTVGCCVHYFNRSTLYGYPGLSLDLFSACDIEVPDTCNSFNSRAVPDDFLECAGRTINGGAALQSGVYTIGFIIIGLIGTYIY